MVSSEQGAQRARTGALAFGAIAFACAGFTAYLVSRMMAARGYVPDKVVGVIVATRNISAAETIKPDMVAVQRWSEKNVPPGALHDPAQLLLDGRPQIAATGILQGEVILRGRLADPSKGTAMAALVAPGFRAVAVKVDNSITRAGLLYPGAFVDAVGTVKDPETHVYASYIAVQHVRVLSVEAQTDIETYHRAGTGGGGVTGARTSSQRDAVVTLEVTPSQVELIALAEQEGEIDLALRNASDDVPAVTAGATPENFVASSAKRAAARQAAQAAAPAGAQAAAEPREARRSGPPRGERERHIELRGKDAPSAGEGGIEKYHAPR